MTKGDFLSVVEGSTTIGIEVDGTSVTLALGQSLLAALLVAGCPGAAADFHCAIGVCQRCGVVVDHRPILACMTYPRGGEAVTTSARDGGPGEE